MKFWLFCYRAVIFTTVLEIYKELTGNYTVFIINFIGGGFFLIAWYVTELKNENNRK